MAGALARSFARRAAPPANHQERPINFPPLPDPHAIAAMLLTLVALVLFTRDKIPLETSSMVVLALLAVGFELFPYHAHGRSLHASEFFHGFGHEALIAVCALMIVGQGLVRTGAARVPTWSIFPMPFCVPTTVCS